MSTQLGTGCPARTDRDALLAEAAQFLALLVDERRLPAASALPRLEQVEAEIELTGTYTHTAGELEHGARIAWRNHTRCLGKLYWRTLMVRDCRAATRPQDYGTAFAEHLRLADHGGRIRPVLSVFRPDRPGCAGPRVLNQQLVQYAGYRRPDGTVRGDPANLALTELVTAAGWRPRGGRFDVLPVALRRGAADELELISVPPAASAPVPLRHPTLPGFADLGLVWYRFPTVANLRLEIGGIGYPLAPFSGWYMCTEIASRNLGDVARYDVLPAVARLLGLDPGSHQAGNRSLWRDRALLELTVAVLHSFEAAGVRMVDHHTLTDQFGRYVQAEARAGRGVAAEWAWMVPPMSPSATPTFHMSFDETVRFPNFVRPDPA